MLILRSIVVIMALVFTYSISSQAQQAEQENPFFDNRIKKQRPNKDRPAPSRVIVHNPTYSGSGCPAGTAAVAMTSDNRAVSIIFDQFTTEAGAQMNKQETQKSCRIIIPLEAPQGYRMAVAQVDYRGFKYLPPKARAKLVAIHHIRHQLVKAVGPRVKSIQVFDGPNSEDFFMSSVIETKPLIKLKGPPILDPALNPILKTCGGLYNLDIDVSIALATHKTNEQAMITLDSIDGQMQDGSVAYHLQWEQCSK